MTPFRLEILTPDGVFFSGMTDNIVVRTTVGDKGILARHEPYVAALTIGKFKVRIDGEFRFGAISSGIIKVDKEKTVILADSCEWAEEIDLERAQRAQEEAERRLASLQREDADFAIAEAKLKRAMTRIGVKG